MATLKQNSKEEVKLPKNTEDKEPKETKIQQKDPADTDRSENKKTPRQSKKNVSLFNYDKDFSKGIKEILDAMDENQTKLKILIGKGIKISNFVNFEADWEQLLGVEINPIIDFFVHNYPTTKDKFLLTFDDFIQITQRWADTDLFNSLNKNEEQVQYDDLEDEKLETQAKSKDIFVLKFDKHSEKIKEIFDKYSEPAEKSRKSKELLLDSQQSSRLQNKNSLKSEDEEYEEPEPISHVKLRHIGKILDDVAYLTGSSIMSYMEYIEGANQKKSSSKAKDEITHYFWKKIHEQELDLLRKNKNKYSIFKPASAIKNSNSDLEKKEKSKKDSKDQEFDSKHPKPKSGEESLENTERKEVKNKNETNNKNDDKSHKEDPNNKQKQSGKQCFDLQITVTLVDTENKDKPKNKKKKEEKKSKKKVIRKIKEKVIRVDSRGREYESEEEVEQEFYETDSEEDQTERNKNKSIAFEDEKFNQEKGNALISYNWFQPYLEDFIHESYDFVFLDSNGEFDDYLKEEENIDVQPPQESNEADPFKKNLVDTINQYEWLIKKDQFEDEAEKETTLKLVESLKGQLKEYDQRKTQSINRTSASTPMLSMEELRSKGLKEIFQFYARQHIPHGIAFEQLLVTMNQVIFIN